MIALEIVCAAIVLSYAVFRVVRASSPHERRAFGFRFAMLAVGALLGEDSVIRAYGYYAYAPSWSVRVDHVPIIVVLVWPVVIDSAWTIARVVVAKRTPLRIALATAGIVLCDAALIEPIAVRAGLWSWSHPGAFDVPLIGIAGWAMFAWAAALAIESGRTFSVPLVAPVATHGLLLASYWLLFKWVAGPIEDMAGEIAAWAVLVPIAILATRVGRRVEIAEILARAPGALFFFVLLATLDAKSQRPLLVYALAFAAPYLVLLAARAQREPRRGHETPRLSPFEPPPL